MTPERCRELADYMMYRELPLRKGLRDAADEIERLKEEAETWRTAWDELYKDLVWSEKAFRAYSNDRARGKRIMAESVIEQMETLRPGAEVTE